MSYFNSKEVVCKKNWGAFFMGRRYGLLFQLKEVHRVHPAATGTIGPDLKMKMVSCGIASGTYLPDHLALYNGITHRNQPCTHVCIHRSASVRMGYGNMIPERGPISREHNCPAFCRQDIRPIKYMPPRPWISCTRKGMNTARDSVVRVRKVLLFRTPMGRTVFSPSSCWNFKTAI